VRIFTIFLILLLPLSNARGDDLSTSVKNFYSKSQEAAKKAQKNPTLENLIEAFKYLSVYRELSAINKAEKSKLETLDKSIKEVQNKILEREVNWALQPRPDPNRLLPPNPRMDS
jgi:hypothetical protein